MKDWITKELVTADLGDKRLNQRMQLILERLSASPDYSVKSSFQGLAEVTGAYRFFDNDKTTVAGVLAPHQDATLVRAQHFERVLFVQDTTELNYTKKKKLEGKGPLSQTERQGFFAHNHLILTPERLPLGVWGTDIYARDEAEHGKSEKRKQRAIEEKESYRWVEGYRDACRMQELVPNTQVIACADRESDIYEVFEEWHQRRTNGAIAADWLIRCKENRRVTSCSTDQSPEDKLLCRTIRSAVEASSLLGTFTVSVKEKIKKKNKKGTAGKRTTKNVKVSARTAELEVRAVKVSPRPPYRKDRKLSKLSFWVVMAKEKTPPLGEDPIDWVLLTNLEAPDFKSAMDVINLYVARWEIEVFHRVLKTGCRVEELQLKKDERTKVAVALYMIVAWRVMYAMKLGRECPELPCDAVFEEDEWQGFWVIVHDGHPEALSKKPSLGEFITKVAEYGGYLGRKHDGPPGPQAIWQGMSQVRSFAVAWQVLVKNQGYKAYTNNA